MGAPFHFVFRLSPSSHSEKHSLVELNRPERRKEQESAWALVRPFKLRNLGLSHSLEKQGSDYAYGEFRFHYSLNQV